MDATKTVVITGASCVTAKLLLPELKAKGYHTIGLIRKPSMIQADEVIADWMNSEKAGKALREADYIVHLSGEINSKKENIYIESNITTTRIVADSAQTGRAKRVIFLSYPNAATVQKNLYLHAKGEAEQLLQHTGKEAVIFRCPVIIDSPAEPSRIDRMFIAKNGKAVPVIGNGNQKIHPVYRGDVVKAIVASLEQGRPGIYELSGFEEMTIQQFIQLVNHDPHVKLGTTPAWLARLLAHFMKGLSPTFVDIMLHYTNSLYKPETYREFGFQPVSLTQLWSEGRKKTADKHL